MADMPTRQKLLLVVLIVVVAVYIYMTFISGDSNSAPVQRADIGEPPPNQAQQTQTQSTRPAAREINRSGTVRRNPVQAAGQQVVMPRIQLEWQNDPFFREKTGVVQQESASGGEVLTSMTFTGFFSRGDKKIVTINGSWYEIGDYIDGMEIIDANKKFVLLKQNDKTYKLFFSR